MKDNRYSGLRLFRTLFVVLVLAATFAFLGCATGQHGGPATQPSAERIAAEAAEAANMVAPFLPPPWNYVTSGVAGLVVSELGRRQYARYQAKQAEADAIRPRRRTTPDAGDKA